MEKSVYSMLAGQVIFSGTEEECAEYIRNNDSSNFVFRRFINLLNSRL